MTIAQRFSAGCPVSDESEPAKRATNTEPRAVASGLSTQVEFLIRSLSFAVLYAFCRPFYGLGTLSLRDPSAEALGYFRAVRYRGRWKPEFFGGEPFTTKAQRIHRDTEIELRVVFRV